MTSPQYIPEQWTVPKDTVYAAIAALEYGLGYTRELVSYRDMWIGRKFRSHREAAEVMEQSIAKMEAALKSLRECKEVKEAESSKFLAFKTHLKEVIGKTTPGELKAVFERAGVEFED